MVTLSSSAERPEGNLSRFSCSSISGPGCVHVVPQGELDIATVPELDRSLRLAREAEDEVVLDLRALDFMDASGGHLLIAADRRARESGGRLLVVNGSGEVAWLLQLLGLDRELDVIESPPRDDATPVEQASVRLV